jgi:hypothetical protein
MKAILYQKAREEFKDKERKSDLKNQMHIPPLFV